MDFIAWIAIDKDGGAFLYRDCPQRQETEDVWMGVPVGCLGTVPDDVEEIPEEYRGLTWEDEPVRVLINISEYTIEKPKPIRL